MDIDFELRTLTTFNSCKHESQQPDGQPPPKKRRGPPPRKLPRKWQNRNAPTRLRKDRPVQTEVTMDVWEIIFGFCRLEKLLELRHNNPTFLSALSNTEATWKQARLNQFGQDHPDPPPGLSEMQYADLLVGVGCQSLGCKEKCTRKTYWAFQRRWCEKCCIKNLHKGRTARDEIFMYDETTKCVPYAMYDSWNHYQWAGYYKDPPAWAGTYGAQSPVFSKPEVKRFQTRFEEFMATFPADGPSQEETTAWLAKQEAANGLVVSQLQKIEHWMENDRKLREKGRADIREKRAVFFAVRAARIDPPLEMGISRGVLALCPSYCRSIEIAKPATEKSWQILREKLKAEREHAAELYAKKMRLEDIRGYREFLVNNRDETIRKRQLTHSEEHCLVLKLGTTVAERILNDSQGIHDLDLVNVFLREVYKEFEKLDDSEKPTSGYGPYRLLMDDARLVYNEIILPLIDRFSCQSRQTLTKARLKCPVKDCRQPEHVADFLRLMEHLHTYHGNILDLDILLIHLRGFPWYTLEWPRNLPMLSAHQEAGEAAWDMDSNAAYSRFPQRTDYGVGQAINQYLLTHGASESVTMTDATYHAICDLNHIPYLNRYECQQAIGRAHLRQLRSMKPLNFYENVNTLNTMIERKPPSHVHSISNGLPRLDDFCSFRCLLDMSSPCNANNAFSAPELMQQFGANFNSDSEDSGSDSGNDCSSCGESDLEFAHTLSMFNPNEDIGTAYFGARFPPLLN